MRTYESTGLIDRQLRARNELENERFYRVLKSLATNEGPVRQLVTIVITDFYNKLDEKGKNAINNKLNYSDAKLGSRVGVQAAITKAIADRIISRVRMSKVMSRVTRVASAVTFNIVMIQGMIEEAARASRRMKAKYPQTYFKVSPMNLDMVYFLAERELEPYLMYINSHPIQCKGIENEICKILAR